MVTRSFMDSQAQVLPSQMLAVEPSDEALVQKVARRDRRAFETLYDRYAHTFYVFAAHLLGNSDSEHVVQEVFLRLWNHARQFDPKQGMFRHWFIAIARNCVMDELRRRGAERRIVAADEISELLASVEDPGASVDELASSHEAASAVRDALRILPEEQRRVIVAAYFGGLTQSEIANGFKLPLGTVKKRLRLGLQKIRAYLTEKNVRWDR